MRPYLEPITPLAETDLCWRYTGPVPPPEELDGPSRFYDNCCRPAAAVRCSLFSGEYFRLDNDCFDADPTKGYADSDEEKRKSWCIFINAAGAACSV
jgi:hypothetical protein